MILSTVNQSITLALAAAVATSQLAWTASYVDHTTTAFSPGSSNGQSNNAAAVSVVGPPAASAQRQLKYFSVSNTDTAAATVTLSLLDGANSRRLTVVLLQPGEGLEWTPDRGFSKPYISVPGGTVTSVNGSSSALGFDLSGGPITTFGTLSFDITSASDARASLGLGGSATLNVGTTAGTVMAGDDSRVVNALPSTMMVQATQNSDTATAVATFAARKSRGTFVAPTAIQSGDYIGGFYGYGYDGTNYIATTAIRSAARENFTTGARGSELRFSVTAVGATGRTENMVLQSDNLSPLTDLGNSLGTSAIRWSAIYCNNFNMGGTGAGNRLMTIDAPSGNTAYIELLTASSRYWLFGRDSSNRFVCSTYNGTGSLVAQAFRFDPTNAQSEFGGNLITLTDNTYTLGSASRRWSVVYAATGTINTSDAREKQDIREPYEQLLDAWENVNWCAFRWKEAVEAKGTDARWHYGLIAQQVRDAIDAVLGEGKAVRLGLVCYDEWEATPAEVDDEGNVAQPAKEAGNRWGLRYEECFAVEAAYMRRRMARIEARLPPLDL